jgi:hypothetical protein
MARVESKPASRTARREDMWADRPRAQQSRNKLAEADAVEQAQIQMLRSAFEGIRSASNTAVESPRLGTEQLRRLMGQVSQLADGALVASD